jgi:uncharacterized membrane protein
MGDDREFGRLLQTTTYQPFKGNFMSKLIGAVMAAAFALVTVSQVAFAQTADQKKAQAQAVAKACEGKAAGTVVKVDGKDVKCPAPAKKK